ncbi:MAG: acyl-CoA desaturase [Planctomycetaceae bacterium]|nr:acyl-CoA desaturase [Planctomycetaceae bacterium]
MSTATPSQGTEATKKLSPTPSQTETDRSSANESQPPSSVGDPARKELAWGVVGWLAILHGGALLAFFPYFFSWQGVALLFGLHWLTGGVGICLGFHRLLTHSSFQTYRPVRWAIAFIGGLAGEGAAMDWVANHRKHHAHSDLEGDPHSPLDGAWWSHVFWLAWQYPADDLRKHHQHWAPDLAKDPVLQFIGKTFILWHVVLAAVIFGLGYAFSGFQMACSLVVWGMFLRLCLVLHATWFVNSASHIWGYRNYTTTDQSRNNWWVAIITYGEGWHNNHHAYPRMAAHGHRWWEFDVTFTTIRLMQCVGLAWNVVDYKRASNKMNTDRSSSTS